MNSVSTVYLVEDDLALRTALQSLLHSAGWQCAAFGSAEEFLAAHEGQVPGCLVLDLRLPGQDGLALVEALRCAGCRRSTVFISGLCSITESVRAMKAGAVDFLVKPFEDEALLAAVQRALEDDARTRTEALRLDALRIRLDSLTARERQVMGQVVRGRLNKQIAADLGTSEKTIKVHRARAMQKMGVQSLAQLVRMAVELGLMAEQAEAESDCRQAPAARRSPPPVPPAM